MPWFLLTERRGRWLAYVKTALKLMGLNRGRTRRPILSLDKEEEREVEKVLKEIGLL